MGVDPGPLTLRELHWMVDARQRDQWRHTAELLLVLYNANRNTKKRRRPYKLKDFYPFEQPKQNGQAEKKYVQIKDVLGLLPWDVKRGGAARKK